MTAPESDPRTPMERLIEGLEADVVEVWYPPERRFSPADALSLRARFDARMAALSGKPTLGERLGADIEEPVEEAVARGAIPRDPTTRSGNGGHDG